MNKIIVLLLFYLALIQCQVKLLTNTTQKKNKNNPKYQTTTTTSTIINKVVTTTTSQKTTTESGSSLKPQEVKQQVALPEQQVIQFFQPQEEDKVVGIILSFKNGKTYDNLFSSVEQKSRQGTIVLTFVAEANSQKDILQALKGNYPRADQDLKLMINQIQKLSRTCPGCIVFNWECSSGYSGRQFTQGPKYVFGLLQLVIKRGYLAMFSDFSLKALINQWDKQVLGPNPFVHISSTNTQIVMKFNKDTLLRSPSAQLQAVGKLANDEVKIHVLGGTITYSVDSKRQQTNRYELQVLSIASNFVAPSQNLQLNIDRYTGTACHVLLTYKEGGKILTSMGHWIQIMKIQTTPEKLFQAAKAQYGEKQFKKIQQNYQSITTQKQRKQFINEAAKQYVQDQSPASLDYTQSVAEPVQ